MITKCKCIEREKDKNGNIIRYKLLYINGVCKLFFPNELKELIRTNQLEVTNLTLTNDNRLIEKKEKVINNKNKPKLTLEQMRRICALNGLNNDIYSAYDEYGNKLPIDWFFREKVYFPCIIGNKVITKFTNEYKVMLKAKEIILPSTITEIDEWAFTFNTNLEKITIPNSITKIDTQTFAHCTKLKELTVPNSVAEIGEYAFMNCVSLEKIKLPTNLKEIKRGWLFDCRSLKQIIVPKKIKHLIISNIDEILGEILKRNIANIEFIYI